MSAPENLPLKDAVAQGLLPCRVCGAPGAAVQTVEGRPHFLCGACTRRGRRWNLALGTLVVAALALGAFLILRARPGESPAGPGANTPSPDPNAWMKETNQLLKTGRYREARERLQTVLEALPQQPVVNLMMGQCLMKLRAYDAALAPLSVAVSDPQLRADAALYLGMAYKSIGHAAQALVLLEQPLQTADNGRLELADVYLDLERYDDALKLLPPGDSTGTLWARHRALLYSGKADEARKLLDSRDPKEVATLRAAQLREEGDFAGAAAALDSVLKGAEPGSPAWHRAKRAQLWLAIESGAIERVEPVAAELAADADPQIQGEALYARALGQLLGGKADAAKAGAWEFLAKTNPEFSPLRLERLMMRRLVGELKDADLEAEAKLLSRFHANDLYWFLAVAGGERSWAEKGLAATPGHNYPYHSLQRLLKK